MKSSKRSSSETTFPSEFARRKDLLTDHLLKKKPLDELIHTAATLMHCPIILTTSYYRVLAMDDCGYEVDDSVWQAARETGYCSAESVALFESEGITRHVLSEPSAFLLNEGLASRIPRILQKVMVFGKPGAYIGLFQMDHPFDSVDLQTANLLCDILSAMLERDPMSLSFSMSIHESILLELIQGAITSPNVLNDRLRTAFWSPKPFFQCILITSGSQSSGIDNADYLSFAIVGAIPDSHIIHVPEGLLLLLNGMDENLMEPHVPFLQRQADRYDLYMNSANVFRKLIHLKAFYETCILVHQTAKRQNRPERITRFDSVVFPVITESLGTRARLTFAQDKYKKLAAYDRVHGTDYCQTLNTYIECGCSATTAAASLYVHRNTMTKRISRIAEICGIDLGSGSELVHFYLTGKLLGKS